MTRQRIMFCFIKTSAILSNLMVSSYLIWTTNKLFNCYALEIDILGMTWMLRQIFMYSD